MRSWKTLACAGALIAGCAENKPPQTAYPDGTEPAVRTETTVEHTAPAAEPRAVEESPGTPAAAAGAGVRAEPVNSTNAPSTIPAPGTAKEGAGYPTKTMGSDGSQTGDKSVAADNTGVNKRDTDNKNPTPMDQGNSQSDINITAEIRKAVVADGSLSMTAKNVKIITKDGSVVLRGPVKTEAERAAIQAAATRVAGAGRVTNQIEIAK
jgi:osmotically-inducible protein OsmY